ncbi:hypothetical protein L484_001103 [Morus notabilis]|uniref:Uncharacterized protein n=1 Tax=Morus notabilis TaxID=981085 RepID=W9S9Y0_9ROSA|nr:hypothetical protein L484_001103 [Morus notabilis]
MTAMAVMTILKPCCCEASGTISLQSINGSTSTTSMVCDSRRKEECLIGPLDDELQFQMPSEISRRILAPQNKLTPKAQNPGRVCDRKGVRYTPRCLPDAENKKRETPDTYKRR